MPTVIQLDILFFHSTVVMDFFQIQKLFVLAMILDEICLTTLGEIIRRHKILARGRKEKKDAFENSITHIRIIVGLFLK